MKINHVGMYLEDIEEARLFFEKYFNGKSRPLYINDKSGFKSYFMKFDDGASIEIMYSKNALDNDPSKDKLGLNHIAFSMGSKEKVDAMTNKFREDGYKIVEEPAMTGDGSYEAMIEIFQGNLLELVI